MTTRQIMVRVALALVPGTTAAAWAFGPGIIVNLAVAVATGIALEAAWLAANRNPLTPLTDISVVVTGLLLALALPPHTPPALIVFGMTIAVLIAKHLYGGLGANVFNPAMAGYAAMLVAYPQALSGWDAISGATALDAFKFREGATVAEAWRSSAFGVIGGRGFEWVNAAFLAGGLYLCFAKIAHWRIPTAVIAGLGLGAVFGYDAGSSMSLGSPLFHWFSGGAMLAAFFIATDPVTAPLSARGQWIFGITIGALIFIIRSFGSFPDGVAFAVLLANAMAPALDRMELRHA